MEVSGQLHVPVALPQGKSPWYPLGGPQSRSGRGGEEKIPSHRRESNRRTPIVQAVAQRYTEPTLMYARMRKHTLPYTVNLYLVPESDLQFNV
jgi:hypothetical protein